MADIDVFFEKCDVLKMIIKVVRDCLKAVTLQMEIFINDTL